MLFLNTTVEVIAREFKFGIVEGISLGEHGRGRQQIFCQLRKDWKELWVA